MRLSIRLFTALMGLLLILPIPSSEFTCPDPSSSVAPVSVEPPQLEWTEEDLLKPPNIIFVLSETFWDATRMTNLTFSRDPIPFFRALQKRFTHGTMLSPMFGGGTANVELEVLTGHSMRFFPENSIPYESVIKHPTASLASILSEQGYTATAISPFYGWFFNSIEVYKQLGFSQLISLEYFNPNEYVGPYIGDYAVTRRIIEETAESPGPDFIFASTMENHYQYYPGKFKKNTIDIKGNGVSPEAIGIAETYAQGLTAADKMLQELVSHFGQVKEPTILVFFGDHLPSLEKYFVYKEAGYISGEDDPDFLEKMYHVPVLIWNNYLPEEQKDSLHMSPSFLGPYVLQLAKRPGSSYTDYLGELSRRMPILPPPSHYEAMNIDTGLVKEYEARQHAILEAEKQAGGERSGFVLGYGEPAIEEVTPGKIKLGDKTRMTVRGGRFGIGSTVFVNGEKLQTYWLSESSLSVKLTKELVKKPGLLEIQVKVIDSKNNILNESKPVYVTVD
ncbi:LTA synthase family protein [Paenibacillus naphthalenovorans]|uniref:LTA synthase family protein n=1 Tax=Paenibacillus naphthalenovorans TaxID=162209 RepID=UPI000885BC44|nr:LTA synthase family protein [Paenibacillus naphthalenovorans]SDI45470.1 Sulfatase [Paenibacillus naphthalenovorans]